MRLLFVGLSMVALAVASGCTASKVRDESNQSVAVHPCTKHPLLRSSGLFGGEQPEIFLSGPDKRREPPPVVDSLTQVLNVTTVDNLGDPGAEPVIDKCRSRLKLVGDDEVRLTIMWNDQNCPDSFDDDDPTDCRSRAFFGFSLRGLGMEGALGRVEDFDAAIQKLLFVDAYFTQEIRPARREPSTLMPLRERSTTHLVVRLIRAPLTVDLGAATR